MKSFFAVAAVLMAAAASAQAGLTGNLLPNGDFENRTLVNFVSDNGDTVNDYRYVKTIDSPQNAVESASSPVRAWQFHPSFDFGRWIGPWERGHQGTYDGSGGITMYDDPRLARSQGQLNYDFNVSLDPRRPGNHVMEGVSFRSGIGVYVQAPTNQLRGPASFDFDYFWGDWTCNSSTHTGCREAPIGVIGWVWGVTEEQLPQWHDRALMLDSNVTNGILNRGDPGTLPFTLLFQSHRFLNWAGDEPEGPDLSKFNLEPGSTDWHRTSDDYNVGFTIDQTYPYYFVQFLLMSFSEQDLNWSDGDQYFPIDKPADEFTLAIDNVDFRMTTGLLADTNLDTLRNALDIQSFVARVTGSLPYMPEADCNQDGVVNALDIQKFVYYITGGTGSVVPEPASMAMMLLAGGALWRRR